MSSEKYIGLDVHQATISVAVLDSTGKLVMESILETKAATILQFIQGLRGSWPDSRGSADRVDPDTPSLSHQATTVGLQRFSFEDLQQRGIPFCRRPAPAFQ